MTYFLTSRDSKCLREKYCFKLEDSIELKSYCLAEGCVLQNKPSENGLFQLNTVGKSWNVHEKLY